MLYQCILDILKLSANANRMILPGKIYCLYNARTEIMVERIRIFGDHHSNHTVEEVKQELTDFISDETDAIYLELRQKKQSILDLLFSKAFLRNPMFILWSVYLLILMRLFGSLFAKVGLASKPRTSNFSPSKLGSEFKAGREIAVERDIDWDCVDIPISNMVEEQGRKWTIGSWATLVVYVLVSSLFLLVFISTGWDLLVDGSQSAMVSVVSMLLLLFCWWLLGRIAHLLYVNKFTASTNPRRNEYMISNIVDLCEENGFDDVCLIVGENHLPHFKENEDDLIDAEILIKDIS